MRLNYRGVSYQSNSQLIQTTESDIYANFRGLVYQIRRPINPSISLELTH
ncbi:MAG: DUF4278 domain-containing protein [Iphinoe sp. HA4291-MV1]|jgi:hypothetical protein|nr:DUF4278 domain-containing protein [Iphinoe sp. HA4291-MV1]